MVGKMDKWKQKNTAHQKTWVHKHHVNVRVIIKRNFDRLIGAKYIVLHYHPGPGGSVVKQPPEYTNTMADAEKRAYKHLRHWNDPSKWPGDSDFGKIGAAGT